MRTVWTLAFAAITLAACTSTEVGPGGGSATITGTVQGETPVLGDEVGVVGTQVQSGGVHLAYVAVSITNKPGTCSLLQQGANVANTAGLSLVVVAGAAGSTPTIASGQYLITAEPSVDAATSTTMVANATYETSDGACNGTSTKATSGFITLSEVTSAMVSGRYDVTFATGDHLSGTFTAPICSVDPNVTKTACQQ
jgi:hypothetical protein